MQTTHIINAETIARYRNYELMGDYILEGDMPEGTRIQVNGNLEVRGNIRSFCNIHVLGNLKAGNIFSSSTVCGMDVEVRHVHAGANVAALSDLKVRGDIGAYAKLHAIHDVYTYGGLDDTANVSCGGRWLGIPFDQLATRNAHLAYYSNATPHSVSRTKHYGMGITYYPKTKTYLFPEAVISHPAFSKLRLEIIEMDMPVISRSSINTHGIYEKSLTVESDGTHAMGEAVRSGIKTFLAAAGYHEPRR